MGQRGRVTPLKPPASFSVHAATPTSLPSSPTTRLAPVLTLTSRTTPQVKPRKRTYCVEMYHTVVSLKSNKMLCLYTQHETYKLSPMTSHCSVLNIILTCVLLFSSHPPPSPLLSRQCDHTDDFYRHPRGHVVTSQRCRGVRDNSSRDSWYYPL